MESKAVVAIVGRPNVGKSALFNRIAGERIAIVKDVPGVTRDRIYADCSWLERQFTLIDTGGILTGPVDEITSATLGQARMAMEEADVILFVVDVRQGVTPADQAVADILRQTDKPIVLVANKVDGIELETQMFEFYSLGLGDPVPVSAEHGRGIGDLLDLVVEQLPEGVESPDDDSIRVAVIGRPNVGKSSLVNSILGRERVIVSDQPGTTRDAIDTEFVRGDTKFTIIDTAGVRRKSRVDTDVEYYGVIRALRAIERSDVTLVVLDAAEGVTEQDARLAGYAHEAGRAIVLVVNKWDLIEKDANTMGEFDAHIRYDLRFLHYAPIMYVSALTGQRVNELLDVVEYVSEQAALRVTTGRLNEALQEAVALREPPHDKGVRLRLLYAVQTGVKPPTILLFVNRVDLMHFSYLRYLENCLRDTFGFVGSPLVMNVRTRR
ncbi:MAG: ribosome biogenesis GTPase Der [Limnochordia bacterium]